MSGQPDWQTHSLLAQFRPEPGWVLDRACFATYSADIRVVTAALLAVAGVTNDPESGSAVQLVQAFRDLRRRVSFVVQRGRIHWPRNIPQVSGLLDRFIFEANYDERGHSGRSWHPKFAVMRWRRVDDDAISWRVWLGSRNLTRDLSLDAGLLLIEDADRESGNATPELKKAVETLQAHLPKHGAQFAQRELDELAKVQWISPPGVKKIKIHWLDGASNHFPQPDGLQQEAIVISPFVDRASMHRTTGWIKAGKPILVASPVELQRECQSHPELTKALDLRVRAPAIEEGISYEPPADLVTQDQGEGEGEIDRRDEARALHAKLMYWRQGKEKRLWIGSPNLTSRGWSRNLEIVAELLSVAPKDPWGPVLREIAEKAERFTLLEAAADSENETQDLLENVRKDLSAEFVCHQQRKGDVVGVVAKQTLHIEAGVSLWVGLPWAGNAPVQWPDGADRISLGPVPLSACSDLLLFLLRKDGNEVGWLMHGPFSPPLGEPRDQASLAEYLGPRGYLQLIRAELEATSAGSAPPWDSPPQGRGGSQHGSWNRYDLPTLEGLLRLFLRDPEHLQKVADTVAMLEKEAIKWESDDAAVTPEVRRDLISFQELWRSVGKHLTDRAVSSET